MIEPGAGDEGDERVGAALVQPPFLARGAVPGHGGAVDRGEGPRGVVGGQVGRQVGHGVVNRFEDDRAGTSGGSVPLGGTLRVDSDLCASQPLPELTDGQVLQLRPELAHHGSPLRVVEPACSDENFGLAAVDDPLSHRIRDLGQVTRPVGDDDVLLGSTPTQREAGRDLVDGELVLRRSASPVEKLGEHPRCLTLRPRADPLPGSQCLDEVMAAQVGNVKR
jgi:hypothetical protein